MTDSVANIITRVQRAITLPPDDTLFITSDFVAFINDALVEDIYPNLIKIRDDYCLVREVYPLQNAGGQDLYGTGVIPIPARAWGITLREIKYIDISGNYYKMNPFELENVDLYQTRNLSFSATFLRGFIPFNSGLKLIPPPRGDNGSIEMHYVVTPSLVLSDSTAFADISNIQFNTSTNIATYTVGTIGTYVSTYCPLNSTALFDIYDSRTGMLLAINQALTCVNGTTFTGVSIVQPGTNILSPDITEISNFQLGNYPVAAPYSNMLYIVPSGVNSFTPLPTPVDNLLVYEVACRALEAQGYVEELQVLNQKREKARKDILTPMALRVDGDYKIIVPNRGVRSSVLSGSFWRRGGR